MQRQGLTTWPNCTGPIGIVGENFLTHFDPLIDNERQALCLDDTGAMAAGMKGTRIALAQPYGTDRDLPFHAAAGHRDSPGRRP